MINNEDDISDELDRIAIEVQDMEPAAAQAVYNDRVSRIKPAGEGENE